MKDLVAIGDQISISENGKSIVIMVVALDIPNGLATFKAFNTNKDADLFLLKLMNAREIKH